MPGPETLWMTMWIMLFGFFFFGGMAWFALWIVYKERCMIVYPTMKVRNFWVRPVKDKEGNVTRHCLLGPKLPILKNTDRIYSKAGKNFFVLFQSLTDDLHYCGMNTKEHMINVDPKVRRIASDIRAEKAAAYDRRGFLERYGTTMMVVGGLMIMFLFAYLFLQQYTSMIGQAQGFLSQAQEHSCSAAIERIVDKLPEICSQNIESFPVR